MQKVIENGLKYVKELFLNEFSGHDYFHTLRVYKMATRIAKEENANLNGTIGIAHTRWATHGIPSKVNSHPHADNSKKFVVVHNGIIENYIEMRKFLEDNGYHFLSDTDTEVIPNLISYFYDKNTHHIQ